MSKIKYKLQEQTGETSQKRAKGSAKPIVSPKIISEKELDQRRNKAYTYLLP